MNQSLIWIAKNWALTQWQDRAWIARHALGSCSRVLAREVRFYSLCTAVVLGLMSLGFFCQSLLGLTFSPQHAGNSTTSAWISLPTPEACSSALASIQTFWRDTKASSPSNLLAHALSQVYTTTTHCRDSGLAQDPPGSTLLIIDHLPAEINLLWRDPRADAWRTAYFGVHGSWHQEPMSSTWSWQGLIENLRLAPVTRASLTWSQPPIILDGRSVSLFKQNFVTHNVWLGLECFNQIWLAFCFLALCSLFFILSRLLTSWVSAKRELVLSCLRQWSLSRAKRFVVRSRHHDRSILFIHVRQSWIGVRQQAPVAIKRWWGHLVSTCCALGAMLAIILIGFMTHIVVNITLLSNYGDWIPGDVFVFQHTFYARINESECLALENNHLVPARSIAMSDSDRLTRLNLVRPYLYKTSCRREAGGELFALGAFRDSNPKDRALALWEREALALTLGTHDDTQWSLSGPSQASTRTHISEALGVSEPTSATRSFSSLIPVYHQRYDHIFWSVVDLSLLGWIDWLFFGVCLFHLVKLIKTLHVTVASAPTWRKNAHQRLTALSRRGVFLSRAEERELSATLELAKASSPPTRRL